MVAFYVLPQAQYERMLPMEIDPKPSRSPVRVGITLHPNLEANPAISQRVAPLIAQLDDPDYQRFGREGTGGNRPRRHPPADAGQVGGQRQRASAD